LKIKLRPYLGYKFLNSFFTGLSIGSVFIIYTPLQPSIYSLGGIVLALGMMVVAKFYDKLLNLKSYFRIGLLVEVVMLFMVAWFLLFPYTYTTALLIYSGYQLTFIFGSYLVRAETIFLKKALFLSKVDIAKQIGYLAGMVISYLFYTFIGGSKEEQVYYLHYLLLAVEIAIITLFVNSFEGKK